MNFRGLLPVAINCEITAMLNRYCPWEFSFTCLYFYHPGLMWTSPFQAPVFPRQCESVYEYTRLVYLSLRFSIGSCDSCLLNVFPYRESGTVPRGVGGGRQLHIEQKLIVIDSAKLAQWKHIDLGLASRPLVLVCRDGNTNVQKCIWVPKGMLFRI